MQKEKKEQDEQDRLRRQDKKNILKKSSYPAGEADPVYPVFTSQKVHFIGIGGIGMSGLASILLKRSRLVSGSDIASNNIIEGLKKDGAKISIGHSAENITSDMTVVYSTDIKENNPEYNEALKQQCRTIHRSECLAELMHDYKPLLVTGTHGKTTTTSLLAWTLFQAEWDPSFSIGGVLPKLQLNARHGEGHYFVAEADESDGSFLNYSPYGAIVTNIGLDHMSYYQTESRLLHTFKTFMDKVKDPNLLFWCNDDHRLKALSPKGISYGFSQNSQIQGSNFRQEKWNISFDASIDGKRYRDIHLPILGHHNALNALAVFGMSLRIGIEEHVVRDAFQSFCGVARRCEKKVENGSLLVIDDYAHHPTEIQTTLNAVRKATEGRRLVAVFQPHRYTRTHDCLGSYGAIFDNADLLVITDIYAAGELPIENVTSQHVMQEIQNTSQISCCYFPRQNLVHQLKEILLPNDVVITLGAGDITSVGSQLSCFEKKKS